MSHTSKFYSLILCYTRENSLFLKPGLKAKINGGRKQVLRVYLSPKINVISVSGLWSKSKHISFSVKPIQHVQACTIASVVSDSLWPRGLWPTRLLSPWDSPGKNTGVSCHTLLRGIFLTQEIESTSLVSPALEDRFFTTSTTWEASTGTYHPVKAGSVKHRQRILYLCT